MAREHDWTYGHCDRCGHDTGLSGVSREDAPPCSASIDDIDDIIYAVLEAFGVDTNTMPLSELEPKRQAARDAVEGILDE